MASQMQNDNDNSISIIKGLGAEKQIIKEDLSQ